jgi:opacity protein-like surface antigen
MFDAERGNCRHRAERKHRRNRRKRVVIWALLLWALAGRSNAQTVMQSWSVSPMAGVTFNPDGRPGTTLAAAIGYEVTPRITVEGECAHIFDMAHDDADVALTLTTTSVSALYQMGDAPFRPYIAAGVGGGWFTHALRVPDVAVDATALGFSVGGGVLYTFTPRAVVRGDFRYTNFTHGTTTDPQQILTVDDVPTVWRFIGGVTIRLAQP